VSLGESAVMRAAAAELGFTERTRVAVGSQVVGTGC
jgi:hypothetical protein